MPFPFLAIVAVMSLLVPAAVLVAGRRLGESERSVRAQAGGAAVAVGLLLVVSDRVAASGILLDFALRPPAFSRFVAMVTLLTFLVARSRVGDRLARGLPIAALIGYARIYGGAHWPTDVIASALLAPLVTLGLALWADRLVGSLAKKLPAQYGRHFAGLLAAPAPAPNEA